MLWIDSVCVYVMYITGSFAYVSQSRADNVTSEGKSIGFLYLYSLKANTFSEKMFVNNLHNLFTSYLRYSPTPLFRITSIPGS
jgi:hypothetical protein